MIKRELKTIMAHKGLMWAMIAVILIPFIYSFCFLTSAWDPYGNTGKIPVAVVNEDEPATLQGKTIQAGADTVAKLHDDDQLEWHFVSAAKAAKGLKDNRYYTVVTIPKDFSKDAATVLDAKPKQMKLTYETNGSLNYVSEIISQVGVDRLNSQIKEKVTTAFVDELFGQIKTIGSKLKTAATGAKQLDTGILKYTDGVNQVNGGLTQLNDNVPALSSGVQQLADGGTQLKDGMGQLQGKVPTLASGVSKLADGGSQLKNGLSQLNGKVPALSSGVTALNAGGSKLQVGLAQVNGEVNGNTADTDLVKSVSDLSTGMDQLYKAVTTKSKDANGTEYPPMQAGVQQLVTGLEALQKATVTGTPNLPTASSQLSAAMAKLHKTVESQIGLFHAFYPANKYTCTSNMLGAGSTYLTEQGTLASNLSTADKNMEAAIAKVTDPTQKAALETAFKADKAASSAQTTKLHTAMMVLNTVDYNLTTTDRETTVDAATGVNDPKGLLTAVTDFDTNLKTLSGSLNDPQPVPGTSQKLTYAQSISQLVAGIKHLNENVPALVAGAKKLDDGLSVLNGKAPKLSTGIAQLYTGSKQLNNGLGTLHGSVPALSSGVQQLYNGSVQESAGLNTLNASVPTLASGVGQLNDGAGRLSTGLNQLNSQVPTLASGVKQLKSGSGQLVANNQQLTDGTSQLSSGLHDGYQQVAATKLTKLTSKMFAAPSKDVQKKYTNVKNYGAALAPYVLALALFIAIIIFNFAYPMKRQDDDGTSLISWLGGKVLIGTLVAVAAALVEATLMLVIGLPVAHIFGFYAMTILFALSAMYLTQVLNLAFNRVGIFVALGLLTLSGSGGLFPAQTISPLYESTQKFLPMTYAINGYREAISGGIAGGTVVSSVFVLVIVALLSLILMIPAVGLQANWNHTSEND